MDALAIELGPDLTVRLGSEKTTLTPSEGIDLAERLVLASFRLVLGPSEAGAIADAPRGAGR